MYIFRNALKSIFRSKGRNILIGIIVIIIATASCVSLAIKQAAKTAEEQGLEDLTITATIGVDRQSVMGGFTQGQDPSEMMQSIQAYASLSLDQLETYATSEYVQNFIYYVSGFMDASGDLQAYETTATSTDSSTVANNAMGEAQMASQGDFTLVGYDSEDAMTDFIDGTSTISEGSMFDVTSSDMNSIISSELSVLNGISVGGTITLANPNDSTQVYTFTVVRIYTNSQSGTQSGGMMFSSAQDAANQIYISYGAFENVISASETSNSDTAVSADVTGTYLFANVDDYNSFAAAVYDMGLDENYTVTSTDLDQYEQSIVSLQNVTSFANMLLWIILGVGGVILIVFNIYSIRERKYEVGVLTAIGMKKNKVASQFMTELFVVTFIAMIVGTIIGSVISVPVADKLLAAQTTSQQTQQQQINSNFGRGEDDSSGSNTSEDAQMQGGSGFGQNAMNAIGNYVSDINATVNFLVILELLGIGVLLTVVSSSAAIIFILRYEPLKILSSRS